MDIRKASIAAILLAAATFAAPPAFAQDDDDPPGAEAAEGGGSADVADEATEAGEEEDEGVETEDIFGFTEGSDTGEAGEKEISGSVLVRTGKDVLFDRRGGGDDEYLAIRGSLEFEYGITDDLKVSVEGSGAHFDQENVFERGRNESGGFDGLSGELKYHLLERGESPIGVALGAETEWTRFDEVEGEQEDSVAVELKGFVDAEIIADRLYAAFNVVYEPEWSLEDGDDEDNEDEDEGRRKPEDEDEGDEESGLELSAALAGQVADGVFLGGELRYLIAGTGLALDEVEGEALFAGPTFYAAISEHAYFKAAWSMQVTGDAEDGHDDLDLENFERHQFLAQVGIEF